MSALSKGVFIVGAKRIPFGAFGGALKNTNSTQLQVVAAKAAIAESGLRPDQFDTVNIANVLTVTQSDSGFIPRHTALHCGIPDDRPALGVNRLCGSGFQAVVSGAMDIMIGAAKVSLTGGVDNMSQAPFIARGMRFGIPLGTSPPLEDCLWVSLTDTYCNTPMAVTAENLRDKYDISREETDKFALASQHNWKKAQDAGVFNAEMAPVKIKVKGKEVDFKVDEHPRPQSTMETLGKLPTIFKKNGVVTAGNASGICDGAGAVIVASEEAVKEYNLTPLARVVAFSSVGCPPEIMGIGPVEAIRNVLKLTGLTLNDIDLVEINEAFAVQTLACAKELGLDLAKLNVNGGAVALGHPLAASGARITAHLAHEMKHRGVKRSIGSACIGGGQGIAILLEAV
jgi:acetyl-CoA acyltransferase 2